MENQIQRVNAKSFQRSFAYAGIGYVLELILVGIFIAPITGYNVGYIFGQWLLPALVTGFLARRSKTIWSNGKYIQFLLLFWFIFVVIRALGRMGQ